MTFALSRRLRQYVHAHSFPPAEGYTSWNEEAVDDMLGGLFAANWGSGSQCRPSWPQLCPYG